MFVRNVEHSDIDLLVPLCRTMYEESVFTYLTFDEEHVRRMINHFIVSDDCVGLVCVADDGSFIGYLGGQLGGYLFNSSRMAFDSAVFVMPSARGSRAVFRLLKAFEDWAKSKDCVEIRIGATAMKDSTRIDKLYNIMGYNNVGNVHARRIQ